MDSDEKQALFVRLLMQNERRIYAYILSLVPNWHDADEIAQETSVLLWKDFDRFEPGTNFAAWALRVAYFQVLTWRKQAARSKLVFSQQFIDAIAGEQEWSDSIVEKRHWALGKCIGELDARQRELLSLYYSEKANIKEVAQHLHSSVEAVYKKLQRVRRSLHRCINQKLAAGFNP